MWAFVDDGETDEPESLGALALASRERLDNFIWVVNCNLQRLDGPVRGNGKIIHSLPAANLALDKVLLEELDEGGGASILRFLESECPFVVLGRLAWVTR